MKLAAVMMQKNEVGLLQAWFAYYSALCGMENLYVFDDHSSEPSVLDVLREAAASGAHVASCPPGSRGIDKKGSLVSETIRSLGDRYDCYLPLDCDEFICVDSPEGPLVDRAIVTQTIRETLSSSPKPLFRVEGCFVNIPGSTRVRRAKCQKILVRRLPPDLTLDNGFHLYNYHRQIDIVASELISQTNIAHLHCHYKPFSLQQRCSQDKLGPLVPRDAKSLRAYKGDSFHVVKYLLMSEQEYSSTFASRPGITPNASAEKLLSAVNAGWDKACSGG
jgi:hypothetical protein